MANIQKMLKQAQKMQKEVEKTQKALAEQEFEFSANGVTAVSRGDFTLTSIVLSEDLLGESDPEMLQDLILVAVNGAISKAREEMEDKLSGITGGMNMPGLM